MHRLARKFSHFHSQRAIKKGYNFHQPQATPLIITSCTGLSEIAFNWFQVFNLRERWPRPRVLYWDKTQKKTEFEVIDLILTQESVELFRLFASLRRWVFGRMSFNPVQNQRKTLKTVFYSQIIYKKSTDIKFYRNWIIFMKDFRNIDIFRLST